MISEDVGEPGIEDRARGAGGQKAGWIQGIVGECGVVDG